MKKHTSVKMGILAFGIPVLLLLGIYAVWGQYPFGNKTLLIWDMNWQYSAFFATLHDILHGDASAFYSFSRALGGNMAGVLAYYLMSPFNLIFYFFDAETIYIGILLLVLLKVGTMGITMYFYLQSRHMGVENVLFSTAYALCAYVIGYFFNVMWLDGLIILPLMVWGIEKLVERGTWLQYVLAVAAAVITNFYIGFMLCLFSVLYFVVYLCFLAKEKPNIKIILHYGMSSLAGGALSAVVTVPTLYVMQGGKERIDWPSLWNFVWKLDIQWLFSGNFAGTIQGRQMILGEPLQYCGVLTFLLVVFYFVGKGAGRKRKCGYLLLLGLLLLSFGFENLGKIWQAFNYANGSPYRFSFIYSFLLIVVAQEAFYLQEAYWKEKRENKYIWVGVCLLAGLGILICRSYFLGSLQNETPWINMILVVVYGGVLLFARGKNWKIAGLCGVLCFELFLNGEFLYQNGEHYATATVEEYQSYLDDVKPLLNERNAKEWGRTVLGTDAAWSVNDPLLLGFDGLDSYTSVEDKNTLKSGELLGYYTDESFGMHYKTGSTFASDSLLGVEYLITSGKAKMGYEVIKNQEKYALFQNPYAFPLAWFAQKTILDTQENLDSTYAYQNRIFQSIDVDGTEIFMDVTGETISADGCMEDKGEYILGEGEELGYVIVQLHIPKTGNVYFDPVGWGDALVSIWMNGEELDLSMQEESPVKYLGVVTPEDDISIRAIIVENARFNSNNQGIYLEDSAQLAAYANKVKNQSVTINRKSDDNISISCENKRDTLEYLVCMIPYDEGWHVKVDGETTQITTVMGNFMAIALKPRTHEIQMRFVPRGLYAGGTITFGTVLLLSALFIWKKRREGAILHKGNTEVA